MKEATKRAASEAFAQMLAVTAMLVIASVIFYRRRMIDRRYLLRPWSSPRVGHSSHPLQEHADMRRQHAAVAMQQRDRGVADLALARATRHLQMGLDQMRHRAADAAMAVTQQ